MLVRNSGRQKNSGISSRTSALFVCEADFHAAGMDWKRRSAWSNVPPCKRMKDWTNGGSRIRYDETIMADE
jgi:hypothetical protein